MSKNMTISKDALENLARKIHESAYKGFYRNRITVFLGGAGLGKKGSARDQIQKALEADWYWYNKYDLFTPEDLFEELISGPHRHDLMSLENILADSVDAIVLVIESPGAIAELGFFAANERLRKKLVCLVNQQYKKHRSFINLGPLRLLNDRKDGRVLFIDFERPAARIKSVRTAITQVRKHTSKSVTVGNVVQAHHFVLPCIYLLEPIEREMLVELVRCAAPENAAWADVLTTGALAILNKNKEVHLTPKGYGLSPIGVQHFANLGRWGKTRSLVNVNAMDELRVMILNWQCRGKPLVIN